MKQLFPGEPICLFPQLLSDPLYYGTFSIAGGNHFPSRTCCFGTYIRRFSEKPFPTGVGSQLESGIPRGIEEASQILKEPSGFF
jgi:hypothetical protein